VRFVDIIEKKRDGQELTREEITGLVGSFTADTMPDYQMAALLMAIFFRGLSDQETAALTLAMADSGEKLDLSSVPGIKVDKHSTGGVADTTTLILAPLVAAAGVPVAKMSGRGLGFTGGTIDKLESIPGFRTALSRQEFLDNLRNIKVAVTGQTPTIAPADGKIYSLRDVTATVESIPLIASSIMSKKIAAGADKIVLDVKIGNGAFMKNIDDAVKLAVTMVRIGDMVGRKTSAIITSMNEPLGRAVGNGLEVEEAIAILSGKGGAQELIDVCLFIGAHMLFAGGVATDIQSGQDKLKRIIDSKQGLVKFRELIAAQGGDTAVIENSDLLPKAKVIQSVKSSQAGYVQSIDTARIGYNAMLLGAGREYKGQQIDLAAGLVMNCRIGDYVEKDSPLVTLHTNSDANLGIVTENVRQTVKIGSDPVSRQPLILGTVDDNGVHLFDAL